ncbi:MAG: nucleoside triphosphate pyrophosphohydrolase [Bacteriovoracaceae bacterium]|nr:nucleoside triphosphate pyrophosphohydrolase [Bacteriovoracaceae bacterium]
MNYPQLEKLIDVIKKLRDPKDGCPWDLEQTHKSLLKYLIEESYEYVEAVEDNNFDKMKDELGDVLLQVLLHGQIASESNKFNIEDIAKNLSDKMIRRHPHVFKDKSLAKDADEVTKNWEQIKAKENKNKKEYFFNSSDLCMPALMSSARIGKRSAKVNFDWDNYEQVWDKVCEELEEVKEEIFPKINKDRAKEEIGDLLFSVAQLARHLEIDPEDALRSANKKFIKRFNKVEDYVANEKKAINQYSLDELESIWQKIK